MRFKKKSVTETEELDEAKYTLKVKDTNPEPPQIPAQTEPDGGFDVGNDETNTEPFGDTPDNNDVSDKPFDDTPFDAGVDANEDEDPKTFIQQLSGKLGQSLRKYSGQQNQPDFDLEKFAVNSVLSATHTGEMDDQDQKDIIDKVKSSGQVNDMDSQDNGGDNTNMDQPEDEEMSQDSSNEENFDENLENLKNSSIFEGNNLKNIIMLKINEVLGDHMDTEPLTKPDEKTITNPNTDEPVHNPSRREKIWSPKPGTSPDPKAKY